MGMFSKKSLLISNIQKQCTFTAMVITKCYFCVTKNKFIMHFLVLSIICSVSVGIIFKMSKRYETATPQIVMWNYAFALLLCIFFFNPDFAAINASSSWMVFLPLMVLLPCVFLLLAASIKNMGIVKTDAAQRLSLFIPLLAAWFIFKEDFNPMKLAGLAVGCHIDDTG